MEFLTLHELSLRLDVSVRVLRSRLRQLLQAGKLIENVDCKRDGYVDETHFVWLVNPVAFMRATELQPVAKPVSPVAATASQSVNQPGSTASRVDTPLADRPDQTLPKVDSQTPSMEREIIDLLKGQMRVKDVQIADLSEQNKALNSLHLKLTGQIVQQADRIQNLLRLTGGKTDLADATTQAGNRRDTPANPTATHGVTVDNPFGNQPPTAPEEQEGERAA
ncbi:MAG: hypothetical protein JNK23_00150 [Opitutaceae bacterium]|nr:hypothetical protein [Opitutaceae bacterium]